MLPGPVFNLELITTARRARYYAIRFIYGMILLYFVIQAAPPWRGGHAALWQGGELSISAMADIGVRIFVTVAVLQAVAVLVLTPALVAGVVADEKRRKTLHYLMASRLSSAEIILGKLFARLLHVGIFLAIGLPVLSLISLFGGVEPLLIVLVYAGTFSTACFLAALAILVSTLARRPREASSEVYVIEFAWLFIPTWIAWLMPMAGGRWVQVYEWIKPVNDLLRWSSPYSLIDFSARSSPVEWALWMFGLQAAYGVGFLVLAIVGLRPIFRREGDGPGRLGWLVDARRGRRFLPRPEVGDDAMLWKERYVSRTSGVVKIVAAIIALAVLAILAYATYQFAAPAFVELWTHGYGSSGDYRDRGNFNGYLRAVTTLIYIAWCLGIASAAASGVVSEREEDTWTSLTATPLSGEEILRAKMFGAVWGTRWLGLLLIVFWLLGLTSGAVHPFGIVAVAVETAVFVWFITALGVSLSLSSTTSTRALSATMAILLIVNGFYLICCIPAQPSSIIFMVGVTPMIEAISLLSYEDFSEMFAHHDTRQVDIILTCVIGVLLYGLAALVLTSRSFLTFDERIDRPHRFWQPTTFPDKDWTRPADRDEEAA